MSGATDQVTTSQALGEAVALIQRAANLLTESSTGLRAMHVGETHGLWLYLSLQLGKLAGDGQKFADDTRRMDGAVRELILLGRSYSSRPTGDK